MNAETTELFHQYEKENFLKIKQDENKVKILFSDFLDNAVSEDLTIKKVFEIIAGVVDKNGATS